jgi:hypothetical protein
MMAYDAVLIVPCTGRRFFPLREISHLTRIFPGVSYLNFPEFSHHAGIFLVISPFKGLAFTAVNFKRNCSSRDLNQCP